MLLDKRAWFTFIQLDMMRGSASRLCGKVSRVAPPRISQGHRYYASHSAAAVRMPSRRWMSSDDSQQASAEEYHSLYRQQMEEMQAERDSVFGFTTEDQSAWSNASGHKHNSSFLEKVKQLRMAEEDGESAQEDSLEPNGETYPIPSFDEVANESLTHLSQDGKDVRMVDVGTKAVTRRVAVAESKVVLPPEVLEAFTITGSDEMVGPKGPIFATAKIAGIMAAKRTSELIPLCHPLPLDSVNLDIRLQPDGTAWIRCECRVTHKTGVEMEALTGASVAALTIYDMTKAVSHNIRIEGTRLISKRGGKRQVDEE